MKANRFAPFPDTHWSLVHRAGIADGEARRQALTTLLQRYQPSLHSYLLHARRLQAQEIEDLWPSFLADKLLQQSFLEHADNARGRFRAFLLTSLGHYVTSWRRRQAVRRTRPLEKESQIPSGSTPTPASIVESAWARTLVSNVIETMRTECQGENREKVWAVFEGRVLAEVFDDRVPEPYEKLAKVLELASPTQAANLLVTAKRMYARLLRKAIGEYEKESGVTQEILELQAVLANTTGTEPQSRTPRSS